MAVLSIKQMAVTFLRQRLSEAINEANSLTCDDLKLVYGKRKFSEEQREAFVAHITKTMTPLMTRLAKLAGDDDKPVLPSPEDEEEAPMAEVIEEDNDGSEDE